MIDHRYDIFHLLASLLVHDFLVEVVHNILKAFFVNFVFLLKSVKNGTIFHFLYKVVGEIFDGVRFFELPLLNCTFLQLVSAG